MKPDPGVMLLANMRFMLFVVAPVRYRVGGAIEPPPPPPPYSEPAAYGTQPQLWGYSQLPPPQGAPMPQGGAPPQQVYSQSGYGQPVYNQAIVVRYTQPGES